MSVGNYVGVSTELYFNKSGSYYGRGINVNSTKNQSSYYYEIEEENSNSRECDSFEAPEYESSWGIILAVPEWEAILTAIALSTVIIITIVGNFLVVLSVFTHKPLRIVQNFFIVSLAIADLTVAGLVLPFNVAYSILGRWEFGKHLCKMWLTCDVLCCTASILNLCAIALDRYWAITDPINYAQKRTMKRVLFLIALVWVLSLAISSPPLLGWNDWPEDFTNYTRCELTKQKGYVIYSSSGSFFIPLVIMAIVYVQIFIATRRRLRERAKAAKLNVQNTCNNEQKAGTVPIRDQDSVSSETNHNDLPEPEKPFMRKDKKKKNKKKKKKRESKDLEANDKFLKPAFVTEDSVTDNQDPPSGSQYANNINHCVEDGNTNTTIATTTTTTTLTVGDSPRSLTISQREPSTPAKSLLPQCNQNRRPVGVYAFIEEKQRISLSKERRAARTLGIIMGVFVVSWLPFFLMYVILPFCPSCCPSDKFINFITWLGYFNSALNPIIYTIFNMDFRMAFKKLLHISDKACC